MNTTKTPLASPSRSTRLRPPAMTTVPAGAEDRSLIEHNRAALARLRALVERSCDEQLARIGRRAARLASSVPTTGWSTSKNWNE